jgi:hypothetical protein
MKQEAADADKQIEKHLRDELRKLQGEVDSSSSKVDEADRTAKCVDFQRLNHPLF